MSDINVTITDNSALFKEAKDEAVARALEAIGLQAEGYAKLLAPVDTGLLRNSITHAVSGEKPALDKYKSNSTHATTEATKRAGTAGKSVSPIKTGEYKETAPNDPDNKKAVYIGSNTEYAAYTEFGTSKTIAQPFLKPAVLNHIDEYRQIAENELRKG